jgi:hypothetical protein
VRNACRLIGKLATINPASAHDEASVGTSDVATPCLFASIGAAPVKHRHRGIAWTPARITAAGIHAIPHQATDSRTAARWQGTSGPSGPHHSSAQERRRDTRAFDGGPLARHITIHAPSPVFRSGVVLDGRTQTDCVGQLVTTPAAPTRRPLDD